MERLATTLALVWAILGFGSAAQAATAAALLSDPVSAPGDNGILWEQPLPPPIAIPDKPVPVQIYSSNRLMSGIGVFSAEVHELSVFSVVKTSEAKCYISGLGFSLRCTRVDFQDLSTGNITSLIGAAYYDSTDAKASDLMNVGKTYSVQLSCAAGARQVSSSGYRTVYNLGGGYETTAKATFTDPKQCNILSIVEYR